MSFSPVPFPFYLKFNFTSVNSTVRELSTWDPQFIKVKAKAAVIVSILQTHGTNGLEMRLFSQKLAHVNLEADNLTSES